MMEYCGIYCKRKIGSFQLKINYRMLCGLNLAV